MFRSLEEVAAAALAGGGPVRVAVAPCAERFVLKAAVRAAEHGLVEPVLVGVPDRMQAVAEECGLDIGGYTRVPVPGIEDAVRAAVGLYRDGEVAMLVKGRISTGALLRAVLNKEHGVPPSGVLSHVALFALPETDHLTLLTDSAVNIRPTMQRKVEIVRNALDVARALGFAPPRVALLAATEKVNYPAMPATLDADVIAKMGRQGQFGPAEFAGPLSLDLALSPESARIKGVEGPVAGRANVLVAPDIESGNMLYKALNTLVRVELASVVVGSRMPIVVPSRGDSDRSKFYSIALAVFLSRTLHA